MKMNIGAVLSLLGVVFSIMSIVLNGQIQDNKVKRLRYMSLFGILPPKLTTYERVRPILGLVLFMLGVIFVTTAFVLLWIDFF
jgi:hypothetical protein